MQMTESEVLRNIFDAADQKAQIKICAELNAVPEDTIKEILKKNGVDLRKLKTEKKRNIHGVKNKAHKNPANAEKNPTNASSEGITVAQACAALIARVAELKQQKADIDGELVAIHIELCKIDEAIGGGIAE